MKKPETESKFTGVKVFSATRWPERAELGDRVTRWIEENPALEVLDIKVRQSSDDAFHMLSFTVFYKTAIST